MPLPEKIKNKKKVWALGIHAQMRGKAGDAIGDKRKRVFDLLLMRAQDQHQGSAEYGTSAIPPVL